MKKKVLHVLQSGSYSGAENVVITIINNMSKQFDCAYTSKDGTIRKVLEENNIPFYPMEKLSIKEIRRVKRLFKPDVIHAHDYKASIICSMLITNTPIISHLHNNSPWIKKYHPFSFVYLISCLKYKKVLTVSSSVMNEYVFGKWISTKSIVVANPIQNSVVQRKAELEENESVPNYDIIFLGRLTEAKDPLRFIKIVSSYKKEKSNIKVAMIGDGVLNAECISMIKQTNIENNVTLTGFMDNPYKILSNAKVLCLTSKWEGFGLVAAEALALGVPVLATPVGGLLDIITEKCGKLCNTNDEFINEMDNLLKYSDYWEAKSKGAYERAKELDNISHYKRKIERIYCGL